MLTFKDMGFEIITKEEFCKGAKVSETNGMFDIIGMHPIFWKSPYFNVWHPDAYYYDNDVDGIVEIKHIKMNGYIRPWIRTFNYDRSNGKKGQWTNWVTC